MKVLLLQPPVEDFYNTDIRLQPIGLAYLKAAAKKYLPEVQITIKDYHHGWGRRTIPLPRELAYLRDYYSKDDKSPFSTFHHYYHFGADFDTIAEEVAKEKPDLVGIASLFAPYHREALRCAEAIKKRFSVPILLGGAQVSTMPETMLAHPAVDFIIQGEGERPFVEFLKSWRRRGTGTFFLKKGACPLIPNLGYKKHGRLVFNPRKDNFPVETLPFPDLSDLPQDHYLFEKKPLCFIITSRGCPYHCAFCSVHKTFGHKCRRRSAENIFTEIKQRYGEGYRVFDFEDDNLTFDRKEMIELCEKLIRTFPPKDIQLLAMNGVCYWTLDRDILRLMRQAGFTHLNLSLVSTNTTLLKTVRRPNSLKKYREVVGKAAALGFKVVAYQILGLPGDTLSSMIKTLLFNARLPVLLGASPFYLIPHSPIARHFSDPSETDIFKARLTAMAIETKDFKREDLYTLLITTRILNFLKGLPFHAKKTTFARALATAAKLDRRSAAGVEILQKLLKEKVFYASTSKGLEPLPHFKPELFFQLWRKIDIITTQSMISIHCKKQ
ncbi:MAG: radical SAM protein [Candidatus Omnitrophota bacterium]|jgi:radical SAM superfamily enzyme YgiQ (UPF0313 family)